jgi:hypothetical protein
MSTNKTIMGLEQDGCRGRAEGNVCCIVLITAVVHLWKLSMCLELVVTVFSSTTAESNILNALK